VIERFQGVSGKANLIDALKQQEIVGNDDGFAERLAAKGSLVEFTLGDTIIEQRAGDNDVYFIVNGEAEVFVNNRSVAVRGAGKVVGEMVAINPTARRSATLKAKGPVLAWKMTADDFQAAAEGVSQFWKRLARMTGERLREREKFHRPANPMPIMFLGSSVEGLELAKALESSFKHSDVVIRAWYNGGVFTASGYTMDDLMREVNECDFAMFVFGPDDKINSRDKDYLGPRDNVILECGLFMGRLGRERVFMVKEDKSDLKIPSDLTGIKPVEYKCKPNCKISDLVGAVRNEIEEVVKQLGAM
jgi:CRP/FNR family cyclic AMP-dependent transcriptional regulator